MILTIYFETLAILQGFRRHVQLDEFRRQVLGSNENYRNVKSLTKNIEIFAN